MPSRCFDCDVPCTTPPAPTSRCGRVSAMGFGHGGTGASDATFPTAFEGSGHINEYTTALDMHSLWVCRRSAMLLSPSAQHGCGASPQTLHHVAGCYAIATNKPRVRTRGIRGASDACVPLLGSLIQQNYALLLLHTQSPSRPAHTCQPAQHALSKCPSTARTAQTNHGLPHDWQSWSKAT